MRSHLKRGGQLCLKGCKIIGHRSPRRGLGFSMGTLGGRDGQLFGIEYDVLRDGVNGVPIELG